MDAPVPGAALVAILDQRYIGSPTLPNAVKHVDRRMGPLSRPMVLRFCRDNGPNLLLVLDNNASQRCPLPLGLISRWDVPRMTNYN